jgi:CheY-like chemotaxis protein
MPLTIVLAVSFDQSLLEPRTLALQSAGHIVESASSLKGAIDLFQSGDFDLILLCYSIPMQDRERLTALLRRSGSRTPIVSITGTPGDYDTFANATLEDDPKKLLAGIRDIIEAEETPASWVTKSVIKEAWR